MVIQSSNKFGPATAADRSQYVQIYNLTGSLKSKVDPFNLRINMAGVLENASSRGPVTWPEDKVGGALHKF